MTEYKSRKNKVSLTSEGVVRKIFCDKQSCGKEAKALCCMNGNCSPLLLSKEDCVIETEFVKGDLLLDRYLAATPEESADLAKMLAYTILIINEKLGCITYDENFRNYIVSENQIYRIDFEETTEGTLEQWCAKVCAFAALYDVCENIKSAFITTLTNNLPIDKDIFAAEYKKELEFLANRWKTKS